VSIRGPKTKLRKLNRTPKKTSDLATDGQIYTDADCRLPRAPPGEDWNKIVNGYVLAKRYISVLTPPGLFQVTVSPGSVTIPVGATQPFSAAGSFSNGTQQTLHSVFWSIGGNPIAVVNADGTATALGAGQTQVGAFGGPLNGQAVPGGSATLNVQ